MDGTYLKRSGMVAVLHFSVIQMVTGLIAELFLLLLFVYNPGWNIHVDDIHTYFVSWLFFPPQILNFYAITLVVMFPYVQH